MTSHDAQAALDDVRRRRGQSRAEYVRYGLSRPYLLAGAVIVFVAFASFDLPNPWGGAVLFPSLVMLAGTIAVYVRQASVRMPLTGKEAYLAVAVGLALVALFRLLSGVADAGGVPAPHAVVAAVLCTVGVLAAGRWRAVVVARAHGESEEAGPR
ncbi:hypothetical protein CP981_16255 [Streptomyces platensis]|uniref:Uncharacterized protein n=2 Tax=Streptomyces TaxID=1883 RepID=A0AAE6NSQ5_STRPT|nr:MULTISPECIES: hypothetical protein [Streptomyces]OSY36220.1 hypothetical protein BG653_06913 [Streptomyces platensis]QEV56856.1 hypothetical protein CP981_16255 [Streptomyces platensis]GFE16353.1 hypothetical protein Sgleb_44000 [Streptomyces glebosus]GHG64370.1 hypothetical protein GCM10010513_32350 [Streptomyces glebosus]